MFTMTVINFLLFTLNIGTEVAIFIVYIQEPLILGTRVNYPLSESRKLLDKAIALDDWVRYLPVSIKLSLSDSRSIHVRWRYYLAISLSFGGIGPSFKIDGG